MGRVTRVTAAVLTFLVLMDSAIIAALGMSSTASVNIYNQVGGTPIRLHCKSRDNDLGEHTLLDGQHFGWGFTPNFVGTTLFSCDFVWGARTQGIVVYEAGSTKRECTHCVWQVHKDGFWVTEDGVVPFTFVAPWK